MARAAIADDIEESEHEPTLRETIESARDEVIDSQVEAREAPVEASGPVRDNSGRFTRRADAVGEEAPAGGVETRVEPAAEQPAAAAQSTEPTGNTLLAPQGWTPAAKAKWSTLPDDIRAEITRRETDMHRTITRQDSERDYGKQFAEVAQAHQDIISRAGVHPARFFGDVMGAMRTLQAGDPAQKAGLIRDLILRNAVDARLIFGAQNPNAQGSAQPSQQQAVIPPELRQVATEWNQFKQQREVEAKEREQREQQQTFDEIAAFRSSPKARFFDAVNDHMVALLQGGVAKTLEEAYEQAIYTRPDIRAILAQEETQAKAQAESKRIAALNARRKGGSVRGGVGSQASGEAPNRSLREELQANFAEARSRV